jgi:hypothetical protein
LVEAIDRKRLLPAGQFFVDFGNAAGQDGKFTS